ncbi:MAG: CBS domain-containing protein [Desulfobacteraceae bacterium]|nr:CBS domain-containing protein [Desulfobacteraceae bacterium]
MPIIDVKNMLSELRVRESMRRIAVSIQTDTSIEQTIRSVIKHKVSAILVMDKNLEPVGVVSKTDIMSAYYAGVPIGYPAKLIMRSPLIVCSPGDSLEQVLNTMSINRIHRVYVQSEQPASATGVISYPDIVGLLYRYCHRCPRSIQRRHSRNDSGDWMRVREIMTPSVQAVDEEETLHDVMERLSELRFGAILVTGGKVPAGVVSKTDLILAYKHGLPTEASAKSVMRSPVRSCSQDEEIAKVIRQMIYWDIRRFFIYRGDPANIVGVLSLSDAAQARSGSCRACMPSRIEVL